MHLIYCCDHYFYLMFIVHFRYNPDSARSLGPSLFILNKPSHIDHSGRLLESLSYSTFSSLRERLVEQPSDKHITMKIDFETRCAITSNRFSGKHPLIHAEHTVQVECTMLLWRGTFQSHGIMHILLMAISEAINMINLHHQGQPTGIRHSRSPHHFLSEAMKIVGEYLQIYEARIQRLDEKE